MARPKASEVHRLADRLAPQARGAFLRAMADVKADANVRAFLQALEAGDRGAAMAAIKLGRLPARLSGVVKVLDKVFEQSGEVTSAHFELRFDLLNPKTLAAAKEHAASFVVETTQETQQAIRQVIGRAFAEGIAPKDLARLIRPMIGLTERQAQAVVNYRQDLLAGEASVESAAASAAKYADKLLRRRAETIARTEVIDASAEGQLAAWIDAADKGLLDISQTSREWIVTDDDRLCPRCLAMDGQKVSLDAPFVTPEGGAIDGPTLHPNCRCTVGLAF